MRSSWDRDAARASADTPKTNDRLVKMPSFPEQLQVISDCALLRFDCFSDNAGHMNVLT